MTTTRTKRHARPLNFAQQIRALDEQRARDAERARRRAARAERRAAAAKAATPQRPDVPDLDALTIPDRQRVAKAMGVEMPLPPGWYGPQPDAARSAQLADKYIADLRAFEGYERGTRVAQVEQGGGFDARTAAPEAIHQHMARLGLDADAVAGLFRRVVQEPGEAPPVNDPDRRVAYEVRAALQRGQALDLGKLTPGQHRALRELGVNLGG